MYAILFLGFTAFAFCLVLTPLLRNLFIYFDVVDRADTERRFHTGSIPRVGGIAIVVSYVLALALVLLTSPAKATLSVQHKALLGSLLPAAGLVFLTGLLDDIFQLKPLQKLAGQILGAALAVGLGARLSVFGGHHASPWVTVPLSLIWLLACTNALNLIDGMDGLAAGVGLLATVTTIVAGIFSGNLGLVAATVPLAGCLLAFLRYNFNPASIFLGDCGSLTIGFMLGCFGLIWSQQSGSVAGLVAPLMAFALPLIDVCLSIGRRYLRSAPILKGDRGHIHHMILARGFNPRAATLILYGVCLIAALLSLMQTFGGYQSHGVFIFIFCVLVFIGVNYLGYVELGAARRSFSRKVLLRTVKEEVYLHELTAALNKVTDTKGCWQIVLTVSADMEFSSVKLRMHGDSFERVFDSVQGAQPSCSIALSIGPAGNLWVTKAVTGESSVLMMRAIVHLRDLLEKKEFPVQNPDLTATDELAEYSGAA